MPKLNFLFILIDDLGWRDLSCYGSDFYETPNLDGLARDGVTFSNAYAACPVCSPTRASILTGKYPATVGVTNWIGGRERGKVLPPPYLHYLPLEETSLASALKEAGYRTYHVGKWHLGGEDHGPLKHGFDVNVAGGHHGMPPNGYYSPYHLPHLSEGPEGEYLTDRLTDEAVRLIEDNGDAPFFMYLSHYAVHIPIQVPQPYVEKYAQKGREMGLDKERTYEVGEHFPCEHKQDKRVIRRLLQSDAVYAGMVENLDQNIGRVLRALEETGQAEDTVVFFFSDNGGLATSEGSPTCNAPLSEGKGWMYEGGTREPLIVRWPGAVAPGSACDAPITSTDFYPTILEMAGEPPRPEQHCDGISLLSLLRGGAAPEREAIFWHYPHYGNQGGTPGASVRAGDYKLIEFYEDKHLELYNLREDVGEEHDLSQDERQRALLLKDMLDAWRAQVGAQIPLPNPDDRPR
jgi:arylsulfatase A-like enzyme